MRMLYNCRKTCLAALLALVAWGNAQGQDKITRQQYIDRYRAMAIAERDLYGIPASITMAQGLFESDNGNSRLAREANNHFGIKCRNDWQGQTITHDDDAKGECFRSYPSAEESYRDHSLFLLNSPRYAGLFKLAVTDYQGWAYGLKAAGYATNPAYALALIKVIEDNKLFLLDDVESSPATVAEERKQAAEPIHWGEWKPAGASVDVDNYTVSMQTLGGYQVYLNNGSEFIVAARGDTFEQLAKQVGTSAARLRRCNDLTGDQEPRPGEMVYIKPKARRANNGKLIHVVQTGDTMHSLSQQYGIRLRSLASMNHRPADGVLVAGQQIRLM